MQRKARYCGGEGYGVLEINDTKLNGWLIGIVGGLLTICGILLRYIVKQITDRIGRLEERLNNHIDKKK